MAEWIIGVIESYGYWGIVALMILENVFPPIPSELIMPFAGFAAARGDLSTTGIVLAGSAGSLLGAMPLPQFLLWSAAGSIIWVGGLTAVGYAMQEQYDQVTDWLNPVAQMVLVVIVGVYVYRVVTFKKRVAQ